MIYTMNASLTNLGRDQTIQTALLKYIPWNIITPIGLVIQIPLTFLFIPLMMNSIEEGKTEIGHDGSDNGLDKEDEIAMTWARDNIDIILVYFFYFFIDLFQFAIFI